MANNTLQLDLPTSWLPKEWEETSRTGNENQVTIMLGHIDPLAGADTSINSASPVEIDGKPVPPAYETPKADSTMASFFNNMTKMAEAGFMKGYTPEKIKNMRKDFNKARDEKYDILSNITVVRYPDETQAEQALDNQLALRTEGFGGMQVMGSSGTTNIFDNEYIKSMISKDQLEKIKEATKKASQEYKQKSQEKGFEYFKGKLLGYPAVMMKVENPEYQRYIEREKKKKEPVKDKKKFVGGGFHPLAGKGVLAKRPESEPPEKTVKTYVAMKVGNYMISGDLLSGTAIYPKGSTFMESLTKTKDYVETETIEGKTYTSKYRVPIASTYAEEGKFHREQAEDMIKKVIDALPK